MQSDDSRSWQHAMESEIEALNNSCTYELVTKPSNNVIGGRWVYCTKNNEDGKEIFKARYVAKGFKQVSGIDYGETFSPTAKLTSVRTLLQVAINDDMMLYQLDVKTAYLNAPIDCDIYLCQPKGFVVSNDNGEELVWKLKKSLYGLKQSGRMWYNLLHNFLVDNNFVQSMADHCVYVLGHGSQKLILIVWVDDIIIAASDVEKIEIVKGLLSARFKMKDFGKISSFLGIEFEMHNNYIKMHQSKYAHKILNRFDMTECHPKGVPCDISAANMDFDLQSPFLPDSKLYREMVGSLIYLMTCTRPDICYVVTVLSQNLSKPRMMHLNLAKSVLRYLKGTLINGLIFNKGDNIEIIGFTDASWASTGDRRSVSGYCYSLSIDSAFISWKSKKQPIVTLSSCESEYVAITHAMQEGLFLKQLLCDMSVSKHSNNVLLNVDNMGAMDLCKNPVHHQRSKHIDIKYHFIRSKVLDESFVLKYVPSKENIADIFTKPCTRLSLQKFNVTRPV